MTEICINEKEQPNLFADEGLETSDSWPVTRVRQTDDDIDQLTEGKDPAKARIVMKG